MAIVWEGETRYHKCDLCKGIFECHLCTIEADHALHARLKDTGHSPVYVCKPCMDKDGKNRVLVTFDDTNRQVTMYDLLLGGIIYQNRTRGNVYTQIQKIPKSVINVDPYLSRLKIPKIGKKPAISGFRRYQMIFKRMTK